MQKCILLVFLFVGISTLTSQTGKITGSIVDSKTGETLPGATVLIEGTVKGASSDFDGNFSINSVPIGKVTLVVSYISYNTKKIAEVIVSEKDVTNVNVGLDPASSKDLQEVTVVVTLNKENNTALVLQQKNSASVSDGISAETIKKTPDRNTSDVLKRVSGASIQDNRFVIVRGLNERYNAAYLNGAPLPSSESDRKAFAFDIFPSNMLDNLVITKTARPDMPGEFGGGIIDVSTKSIPEKDFLSISVSSGYNNITTGKEKLYYKGGKTDWLGIDDGTRSMPSEIPSLENYPRSDKNAQAAVAKTMPANDWETLSKSFGPNTAFQLSSGHNFKRKDEDFLGIIFSLSYNRNNNLLVAERNSFSDNLDPDRPSQLDAVFYDNIYSTQTLAGALLNLSWKINSNNSISSKNLYSINSDDRTIKRNGTGGLASQYQTLSKTTGFWFTSNRIASTQLIGDHFLPQLKTKINWLGSFSNVKRDVPNMRRNSYSRAKELSDPSNPNPLDTTYQAVISPSSVGNDYGGFMFWSSLNENLSSIKTDVLRPFKISSAFNFDLKAGALVQQRARVFDVRQFGYTEYATSGAYFDRNILIESEDQIFRNENMGLISPGRTGFKLTEGSNPTDSYEASSLLKAGYLMMDAKYTNWFRAVVGARIESYRQKLIYPDKFYLFDAKKVTKDTTVIDVLPSVNLIFSLSQKQNLRLSYSQTLNRPEFREIAPFGFYDFTTLFFTSGNDTLQRSKITNYDIRYEIFPGRGQLFSASGFYKHFANPIEQIARPNMNEISYANVPTATCYGIEVEYRLILGTFLKNDSTLFGKVMNNLTLFTNIALIKSFVDISNQAKAAGTPDARPLQGQSPYLFNAGLIYADNEKGYSLSAIVNRVGQRISVVGNYDTQLDIWENGRTALDLQASKTFLKNKLEVRITVRDALARTQLQYLYTNKDKDPRLDIAKDDVIRKVRFGSTFNFQVTYKF